MALAPFSVLPPAVMAVNVPVVLIKPAPLSTRVPLEVNEILLAAPAIVPVTPMLPVLLTEITPTPVCEIPLIVKAEPFVSDNAPPPVLVALKFDTALDQPRV